MKYGMVLLSVLLLAGCEKDRNKEAGAMARPGTSCSGVLTTYSGAIQTSCLKTALDDQGVSHCVLVGQDVATNADISTNPYDRVDVELCTNADCETIPSTHIVLGHHSVRFIDVDQPIHRTVGSPPLTYQSYTIKTLTCG